jgi:hypothetical protein
VILDKPELHVDGQVMVPDLAGWRREHMPVIPDGVVGALKPTVLSTYEFRWDRYWQ